MAMMKSLVRRADFKIACDKAKQLSKDNECCKYIAYVARNNCFKVSDWHDDATVTAFSSGIEAAL